MSLYSIITWHLLYVFLSPDFQHYLGSYIATELFGENQYELMNGVTLLDGVESKGVQHLLASPPKCSSAIRCE